MTVGIDCGARKLALVCPERGVFAVLEVKKIDYERFYEAAGAFFGTYQPMLDEEKWFVEAPVVAGARNLQSTIKVAQTVGIVHALAPNVTEVAVSSWKKATVGNGNASKAMVKEWLDKEHPDLALMCRGNQDLYDAACIALHKGG